MAKEKNRKNSPEEATEEKEPLEETQSADENTESASDTENPSEKLAEELKKLQEENSDYKDKLLRSAAEFDNYRKRTTKEKEEMLSYSKTICIKEVLGVIDNFERALAAECKDADFKKGMEMIFNQMQDSMKKLGVTEIEAFEKPFDPELHNAIKQVQDEEFGENIVCQVLQKGYRLEDRVIRHAMVVVANP